MLLIFSNTGCFDRTDIVFRNAIETETESNWAKGPTLLIQEFIRDDGILEEFYEDEHKGLKVEEFGPELYELFEKNEWILWADTQLDPTHYVHIINSNGEFIYVIYKV